ncbi:MAG: glycosyltransferase family 39 protein [Kiritimatiellia bacterium]|nr:glycosyltransferase family 39 protein [Kiritimatiellia bacterium]
MLPTPSLIDRIKNNKLFRTSASRNILLLVLLWVLAGLLVNPIGEFPLNDAWAYAQPVKTLCEEGLLRMSGWTAMPLIAHIGWGWLATSIFWFSFTVLRLSVALLGLGGMLIAWQTLRELTGDEEKAMLGALAIGFNGIYFNLSYTFMTDVPFFFYAMLSMYCYMRSLRDKNLRWLVFATLSAAAATLIRQVGLLLPLPFMLACVIHERFAIKAWLRGAGSMIFVYGALIAYERWMEATVGLPDLYRTNETAMWRQISAGLIPLIKDTKDNLIACMVMLGLFMFPVLLLEMPRRSRRDRIITWFLTAGGLALGVWLACEGRKMPLLSKGIFVDFALGPPTLCDVFCLERDNLYKAPPVLLWLITFLGSIGAFWLLRYLVACAWNGFRWLFRGRGEGFCAAIQVLGMGSALIILLPLGISQCPFDRYLLACVPGLLLGIAAAARPGLPLLRWQRWVAVIFIMGSAIFAVVGTHDYLAWNRARWRALDYLCKENNIPPTNIDGGFEFNGWFLFNPAYKQQEQKSWWWVHDDEFIVAFGLVEHHRVNKSFPYIRWCPPMRDFIAVIEYRDLQADNIQLASTARDGGRNVKTPDGNILRHWNGRGQPVNIARDGYVFLEPGSYRARFTFAAGKPLNKRGANNGSLHVLDFNSGKMLVESEILNTGNGPRQFINQELPFWISTNLRVGVHIMGGNIPLWLDSVQFIKADK